jgi:hypothetical protein
MNELPASQDGVPEAADSPYTDLLHTPPGFDADPDADDTPWFPFLPSYATMRRVRRLVILTLGLPFVIINVKDLTMLLTVILVSSSVVVRWVDFITREQPLNRLRVWLRWAYIAFTALGAMSYAWQFWQGEDHLWSGAMLLFCLLNLAVLSAPLIRFGRLFR